MRTSKKLENLLNSIGLSRFIVAGVSLMGDPDFYFCWAISCLSAKRGAKATLSGHLVVYSEYSNAGKAILSAFDWKTAPVYSLIDEGNRPVYSEYSIIEYAEKSKLSRKDVQWLKTYLGTE